jgi:hypothetical protein
MCLDVAIAGLFDTRGLTSLSSSLMEDGGMIVGVIRSSGVLDTSCCVAEGQTTTIGLIPEGEGPELVEPLESRPILADPEDVGDTPSTGS